jgi:carbonic anhydrase/acetyltransferase-like protein (isoleucine patch superfamily)
MTGGLFPFDGVTPTLGRDVFIAPGASVIGDVEIGEQTGIWYGCVLRGDVNEIRIGARVNIQDGTVIHVASKGQGTYIGDEVSVGHMALLHACTVEARAFIGMKAVVMDGAHVESGAMVAAGALVTPGKRVKSGELWTGWPAAPRRALSEDDIAMMTWTHSQSVGLAAKHRASLSG